jgi:twitching motility two-component system response regulator PilH
MANLLVVEDDEATRELLKHVLSGAGHSVRTADDGRQGLDAVAQSAPDLIVLDIMLPEVHGFSVCHSVKHNPATQGVKVLMLSAKSFAADRRQAEEAGADGFLSKPVNPGELLSSIKNLLGKD